MEKLSRAFSILNIKSVDTVKRSLSGVATTPSPDRSGDIVEPLGVKFQNPMPLLRQHDSKSPVGTVNFDAPTANGINFTAELPNITEPGPLKDRVDLAWQEIQAGLIRAVSIGFRALEYSFIEATGGIRFSSTEVVELSLVAVPANAEATLRQIKSIDGVIRAASGIEDRIEPSPRRLGTSPTQTKERTVKKTIAEMIKEFEASRAAKAARMSALLEASTDEGRTLDQAESDEYDALDGEVKAIDAHLVRLNDRRRSEVLIPANGNGAVDTTRSVGTVSQLERGSGDGRVVVKSQPKLGPGIRFARLARAKAIATYDRRDFEKTAEALYGSDSEIAFIAKAAVPGGTTIPPNWASGLVGQYSSVFADFVEFLRPQTIVGKFGVGGIPSLRKVPFRVALVGQTSGGVAQWVGEAKAKPVTSFGFARNVLTPLKIAAITALSMEVIRDSSPSAEQIILTQIAETVRARMDQDFIDPTKAPVAGISPGSITNGVVGIPSSGAGILNIKFDVQTLFAAYFAANNSPSTCVWIMNENNALALAMSTYPMGEAAFPGVGFTGGTFAGLPVITSQYVPITEVILANANDIYFGDDGDVNIDISMEASLEMSDAPVSDAGVPTPAGTTMVSLWQTNMAGFRAERTLDWLKRRPEAVQMLTGVAWATTAPMLGSQDPFAAGEPAAAAAARSHRADHRPPA